MELAKRGRLVSYTASTANAINRGGRSRRGMVVCLMKNTRQCRGAIGSVLVVDSHSEDLSCEDHFQDTWSDSSVIFVLVATTSRMSVSVF